MENNSLQETPLISLEKAVKTYGHLYALKNIDLSIYKGSSLVIFGPNGAGKSTLLKILSMQCRLSSGSLLYNNIPYKKLSDDFRQNFGIISHQSFLYGGLTAFENLKFYASLYGIEDSEEKAASLLKRLDIYKRKDDLVRSFSRGMLQKISIARALIHNPEIIFLDEPYSGLDAYAAIELTNILKEQLQNKKTIIMVTHDINTGLALSDNVAVMNKGKIVYKKAKNEIDENSFNKIYMQQIAQGVN